MYLNKVTADLNYVNSAVVRCIVSNSLSDMPLSTPLGVKMDVSVGPIKKTETGDWAGELLLIVQVNTLENDVPTNDSKIEIALKGNFTASGEMPLKQFSQILALNGTAALYGILRGKIETISSTIYSTGKISLPLINVMDFFREKSQAQQAVQAEE